MADTTATKKRQATSQVDVKRPKKQAKPNFPPREHLHFAVPNEQVLGWTVVDLGTGHAHDLVDAIREFNQATVHNYTSTYNNWKSEDVLFALEQKAMDLISCTPSKGNTHSSAPKAVKSFYYTKPSGEHVYRMSLPPTGWSALDLELTRKEMGAIEPVTVPGSKISRSPAPEDERLPLLAWLAVMGHTKLFKHTIRCGADYLTGVRYLGNTKFDELVTFVSQLRNDGAQDMVMYLLTQCNCASHRM